MFMRARVVGYDVGRARPACRVEKSRRLDGEERYRYIYRYTGRVEERGAKRQKSGLPATSMQFGFKSSSPSGGGSLSPCWPAFSIASLKMPAGRPVSWVGGTWGKQEVCVRGARTAKSVQREHKKIGFYPRFTQAKREFHRILKSSE